MRERSAELIRRHDELAVRDDGASSTARVAFGGKVFVWRDLPAVTRRLARRSDPVLAERVVTDSGLYSTQAGLVQVMRGWRAHHGAVLVAIAARSVLADDEEVRPTGQWEHLSLRSYDAAATPRRRTGVVRVAPVVGQGVGTASSAVDPAQASARDAWQYLPAIVREGAQRVVPVPDDWIGDLRQHRAPGVGTSQDIAVLLRSSASGVVVVASRTGPRHRDVPGGVAEVLAQIPWSVEQITYDLHEPAQLGPAPSEAEAWPWT